MIPKMHEDRGVVGSLTAASRGFLRKKREGGSHARGIARMGATTMTLIVFRGICDGRHASRVMSSRFLMNEVKT